MTLDGFLTFLTLIVGAASVAPTVVRLRLRLRMVALTTISILGFGLVFYLEILASNGPYCPDWLGVVCPAITVHAADAPTAGQLAFIVVMAWAGLATISAIQRDIAVWALPTLRKLVSELLYQGRLSELVDLTSQHMPFLCGLVSRQVGATVLATDPQPRLDVWLAERFKPIGGVSKFIRIAEEILRELLLSEALTEFIAIFRPAFGVLLLQSPTGYVQDFSDVYLSALIASPKSSLYKEIKANQNLGPSGAYLIPTENRLLHFLLVDARRAEKLGVWQPLGDWLLARLRRSDNSDYIETLNLSCEGFRPNEIWRDPTFVVIRFFDIMVSAAAEQDIQWHMWLYYYPHFIERLASIYDDSGPEVDRDDEFPTRASYLMYEMFSAMRSWTGSVTKLKEGSSHRRIESESAVHENGNIPKSAILAIGMSLHTIALAQGVGLRFKRYLFEIIVRLVDEMPRRGELAPFRRALMNAVVKGGAHERVGLEYRVWLRETYGSLDPELRMRNRDFEVILREGSAA